jgi:hypothetical protein
MSNIFFNFLFYCSVVRLPASPAAEKKQKQWLNMSPEKRRLSNIRTGLSEKTKRQAKTLEESEKHIHHKFSTALCIHANQHKMKLVKINFVLGVQS